MKTQDNSKSQQYIHGKSGRNPLNNPRSSYPNISKNLYSKTSWVEMLGLIFVTTGILVFLAVLSLQNQLAIGQHPQAANNSIGILGHVISENLFFLFGKSALSLGPYLIILGIVTIFRGGFNDPMARILAILIMMIGTSMLTSLFFEGEGQISHLNGGLIGSRFARWFVSIMGNYGAVIGALAVLCIGFSLAIRIPMPVFLHRLRLLSKHTLAKYKNLFNNFEMLDFSLATSSKAGEANGGAKPSLFSSQDPQGISVSKTTEKTGQEKRGLESLENSKENYLKPPHYVRSAGRHFQVVGQKRASQPNMKNVKARAKESNHSLFYSDPIVAEDQADKTDMADHQRQDEGRDQAHVTQEDEELREIFDKTVPWYDRIKKIEKADIPTSQNSVVNEERQKDVPTSESDDNQQIAVEEVQERIEKPPVIESKTQMDEEFPQANKGTIQQLVWHTRKLDHLLSQLMDRDAISNKSSSVMAPEESAELAKANKNGHHHLDEKNIQDAHEDGPSEQRESPASERAKFVGKKRNESEQGKKESATDYVVGIYHSENKRFHFSKGVNYQPVILDQSPIYQDQFSSDQSEVAEDSQHSSHGNGSQNDEQAIPIVDAVPSDDLTAGESRELTSNLLDEVDETSKNPKQENDFGKQHQNCNQSEDHPPDREIGHASPEFESIKEPMLRNDSSVTMTSQQKGKEAINDVEQSAIPVYNEITDTFQEPLLKEPSTHVDYQKQANSFAKQQGDENKSEDYPLDVEMGHASPEFEAAKESRLRSDSSVAMTSQQKGNEVFINVEKSAIPISDEITDDFQEPLPEESSTQVDYQKQENDLSKQEYSNGLENRQLDEEMASDSPERNSVGEFSGSETSPEPTTGEVLKSRGGALEFANSLQKKIKPDLEKRATHNRVGEDRLDTNGHQEITDVNREKNGDTNVPTTNDFKLFADDGEDSKETCETMIPAFPMTRRPYSLPTTILDQPTRFFDEDSAQQVTLTSERLKKVLLDFGVRVKIVDTKCGPVITRYEIKLEPGVKVSRIQGLQNELRMNLEAPSVRILAPVPGKSTVGIEVPNRNRAEVLLRPMLENRKSQKHHLDIILGADISGNFQSIDLTSLPHLLIAGTTGAGKSVFLNCVIASLLYGHSPQELRLLMIDPKMVELTLYHGIPHLIMPVITDVAQASQALNWLVTEMETRYSILSRLGCRDIRSYNRMKGVKQKMPYLVVIIDELADLMMIAPKEVEDYIIRLTQKARAVGIHVVMATQRPSVDVITGMIKANCPARIAFHVAQKSDSRIILDSPGADILLGRGDLLYKSPLFSDLIRIQAPMISEKEIAEIVRATRSYGSPRYIQLATNQENGLNKNGESKVDPQLIKKAWQVILDSNQTSISYIQRRLSIGYNKAANIVEALEKKGYLSKADQRKERQILHR